MNNQIPQSLAIAPAGARRFRRILVLAAIMAGLGLPGCVIMSDSQTTTSGRKIDASAFDRVDLGKSKDFVVGIMGEPSEKRTLDGGIEQWRWRYTERHESSGGFIVLFASHNSTTTTQTRIVEFKDGVVTRVATE